MAGKRGNGLVIPFVILLVFVSVLLLAYLSFEHLPASFLIPSNFVSGPSCNCSAASAIDLKYTARLPCSCSNSTTSCPPLVETIKVIERVETAPKQWFAEGKDWHYPGRFPLCTMDACFNFSRCENMLELLVYHYDIPTSPGRYFTDLEKSVWHTSDPEKACLFFVFSDLDKPQRPHPNTLPFWNHGLNHVIITFADRWPQRNPPPETIEFASVLSSELHETTYRPGFDISIPLPPKSNMQDLQPLLPSQRKYFLTFRGLRYLGERGEGTFRSRKSFRDMHNGKDVIVATTCRHGTNDIVRRNHPEFGDGCDEDQKRFDQYTYADLMNSTFGFAPAGRSPSSYRFIEVLSAGTIPVLIADNYVKPFDTLIQWQRCTLQFPTLEMDRVLPSLRALSQKEIEQRQKYCLFFYNEFLKDDATLLRSVIRSLKARFYGVFGEFSEVLPLPSTATKSIKSVNAGEVIPRHERYNRNSQGRHFD